MQLGLALGVFARNWDGDSFRCVAVAISDRFGSDASRALSVAALPMLTLLPQLPLLEGLFF